MKMYRYKSAVLFPGLLALLFLTLGSLVFGQDTAEANKALARQLYNQVFNEGNIDAVDEFFSDDFVDHDFFEPGVPGGRDDLKAFMQENKRSTPDFTATVEDLIAEGDKVVARVVLSGTPEGEYMGMPATGESFSITIIDILRVENGQFVEHWGLADTLTMMMQLGMMPPPEQ